jgi:hypothetical protein
MNKNIERIITLIETWLSKQRLSEVTLGIKICGNPRAFARIRSKSANIDTLNAVLNYIEKNR